MKNETVKTVTKIDLINWVLDNSDEFTQLHVETAMGEIDKFAEMVVNKIKMNVPDYVSFSGEIIHYPFLIMNGTEFSHVEYVKKEMQVTVDYKRSKEGGEPDERISMIDEIDFRSDELDGDDDLCDIAGKKGYAEIKAAYALYITKRNKTEAYFERLFNEHIKPTL